jgi:hypothetical protein
MPEQRKGVLFLADVVEYTTGCQSETWKYQLF